MPLLPSPPHTTGGRVPFLLVVGDCCCRSTSHKCTDIYRYIEDRTGPEDDDHQPYFLGVVFSCAGTAAGS